MNSQALQKRIIDGKHFPPAPIGEWPCDDLRRSMDEGSEEGMNTGVPEIQRIDTTASFIASHRIRNWGTGFRLRPR
jgi:hypothetical protein